MKAPGLQELEKVSANGKQDSIASLGTSSAMPSKVARVNGSTGSAAISLEEAERSVWERLTMELHDGAAQTLFAAMRYLQLYRQRTWTDCNPDCDALLAKVESLLQRALQQVREVASLPPPLCTNNADLSLVLQEQIAMLEEHGCRVIIQMPQLSLPDNLVDGLRSIASEALHNITKHARARLALVRLWVKDGYLRLHIRDWGIGFRPSGQRSASCAGFGLRGMRRRAEALGGSFRLFARPGWGTSIHVSIQAPREVTADGRASTCVDSRRPGVGS